MVTRLPDDTKCSRNWTGNNRVNRNFFGRVRLQESPLTLGLHWKESDNVGRRPVGKYALDLRALLANGFIRIADGYPGDVIVRFQRTDLGEIQIATNWQAPALTVGEYDAR